MVDPRGTSASAYAAGFHADDEDNRRRDVVVPRLLCLRVAHDFGIDDRHIASLTASLLEQRGDDTATNWSIQRLDIQAAYNVSQVRLSDLARVSPFLDTLSVSYTKRLNNLHPLITSCPSLTELNLRSCALPFDMLDPVVQLQHLRVLRLNGCSKLSTLRHLFTSAPLAFVHSLCCLDISGIRLANDEVTGIERCVNLKELRLANTSLTDISAILLSCTQLVVLDLGWLNFNNGVSGIERLTGLKDVVLCHSLVGGDGRDLARLSRHGRSLQRIVLPIETTTSDTYGMETFPELAVFNAAQSKLDSVAHFSVSTSIRELILCDTPIANPGISGVGSIASLEALQLDGTLVTSVENVVNRSSVSLHTLSLANCKVLSQGIAGVEDAPVLRTLNLTKTRIAKVSCLCRSRSLTSLSLAYSRVTTPGIIGLEQVSTLRTLDLEHTGVTSVTHLSLKAASSSLTSLSLLNAKVDTAGISTLQLLPRLKVLNLSGTLVDNVSHLGSSSSLEDLNLQKSRVTTDGIMGLENCPSLTNLTLCRTAVRSMECLATSRTLKVVDVSETPVVLPTSSPLRQMGRWIETLGGRQRKWSRHATTNDAA